MLLTAILTGTAVGANPPSHAKRARLTWAPPTLTNPITIDVPSDAPVDLKLSPTQDYVLRLGRLAGPGGLAVWGGHNIRIVGGEVDAVSDSVEQDGYALRFYDQTGTVHIEGVLIEGGDAITIQAPLAVFQIENVRAEIHAYQDNFAFAHPDLIQTWSGPAEVKIDRFTGVSDYQGFTWMRASPSAPFVSRVVQRNVNVQAAWPQPGSTLRWPDGSPMNRPSLGAAAWHVSRDTFFSCQNCWVETGWYSPTYRRKLQDSMGGWQNGDGSYTDPPYRVTGRRSRNLGRRQGDEITWPKVGTLAHEVWRWGHPRGGDFVPLGVAGVGYVSPGYTPQPRVAR